MRLLETHGCQGGAHAGYVNAGWEVTGVDINTNHAKYYPGQLIIADAATYIRDHGHEYDAIHTSPPCQWYTRGNAKGRATGNSKWQRIGGRQALEQPVPRHRMLNTQESHHGRLVRGDVAALADVLRFVLVASGTPVGPGPPFDAVVVTRLGCGEAPVGFEQPLPLQVDADAVGVDGRQAEHAAAESDRVAHVPGGVGDVLNHIRPAGRFESFTDLGDRTEYIGLELMHHLRNQEAR